MAAERPEDSTVTREKFQKNLRTVAGIFIVENLWKILVGLAGFFSGGAVTYVAIWSQVSDARHAAYDAKETAQRVEAAVSQLVTQRELEDAKERISSLEDRLDYATRQAGTPPVPRHPRKK